MVQQSGIVKRLPESKNTYQNKNFQNGYNAEKATIYLMNKKGWELVFQRLVTDVAEIDLVFIKKEKVVLLEVKKLDQIWRSFQRIDPNQIQKLQKNRILFKSFFSNLDFLSYVVWVNSENRISFVEIE